MTSNRFLNGALAALVALAFLATIAPPAAAQAPTNAQSTLALEITPFEAPIRPLSGLGQAQLKIKYGYVSAGATALTATKVTLSVAEAPSWAVITISPSTVLVPIKQPQGAAATVDADPQTAIVYVATTADAPAFTPANIKIKASAAANQPIAAADADVSSLVQADYFSVIDVQVQQPIRIVRPQTAVDFPVTITNFGNGNSKVAFELVNEPSGGLQVPIPQPVTLEARQTGGKVTQQTVSFSISTPFKNGYMNQPGLVTVKLKAAYALNSQIKGEEIQFSVLATTKGFYVPGPSPMLAILAVGLVAAVLGARRNR